MSMERIRVSPDGIGYYHVMSRTVADSEGGLMLFGAHEKNVFAKQMRKHAAFAGIEVLTWCMMDNHFHILIRIPEREAHLENLMANGRSGFWKRLRHLYDRQVVQDLRSEVEALEAKGKRREVDSVLAGYTRRMADLSEFMRGLKQAFSIWFNRKYQRRGTLWMGRFKSVLLEGEPAVLLKVSAYIDLNPVRAGLVSDPARYRWSGYGQALGGSPDARRGLSLAYLLARSDWMRIRGSYRDLLFLEGTEVRGAHGAVVRKGVKTAPSARGEPEASDQNAGGRLAARVRYFSHGAAIGSREFVERVFENYRTLFGTRRQSGARRFRGAGWRGAGMFALRDLSSD